MDVDNPWQCLQYLELYSNPGVRYLKRLLMHGFYRSFVSRAVLEACRWSGNISEAKVKRGDQNKPIFGIPAFYEIVNGGISNSQAIYICIKSTFFSILVIIFATLTAVQLSRYEVFDSLFDAWIL